MKNSPADYNKSIETRHNMSAADRSVGAHARLPAEHPLHGSPDLIQSPMSPKGTGNSSPAKAAHQMKSLPKSDLRPGNDNA
jgi:hypothetical protein